MSNLKKIKKHGPLLVVLLIGLALGLAAGWMRWKAGVSTYPEIRRSFVTHQAQQFGRSDTLLIGDSLIEAISFGPDCGRTFNAGVAGARVKDFLKIAGRLKKDTKPDTVVIAIRANDLASGDTSPKFRREYRSLLAHFPKSRLILVGIANSEEGDHFVRNIAHQIGAKYVSPVRTNLQPDGLHHTVRGSIQYARAIANYCRLAK